MSGNENKTCPYCGEEIKAVATKCRYCQTILDNGLANQQNEKKKSVVRQGEKRRWFSLAVIALLVIIALLVYSLINSPNFDLFRPKESSDQEVTEGSYYSQAAETEQNTEPTTSGQAGTTEAETRPEQEETSAETEAPSSSEPATSTIPINAITDLFKPADDNINAIIDFFKPADDIPMDALVNLAEEEKQSNIEVTVAVPVGNSFGNIINSGIVASQGSWIYYANANDGYKIYKVKTDGTERSAVNKDSSFFINLVGDWLYYMNDSDGMKIYKIKTNGQERKRLNNDKSQYLNVVGDWIYYVNENDGMKIYKIQTDGSNRTKINNNRSYYINVVGDWIYYTNADDRFRLTKIRTDGTMETKFKMTNGVTNIIVDGETIYFTLVEDRRIARIDVNETFFKVISYSYAYTINLIGDWIYYVGYEKRIYKIRTNGLDEKMVDIGTPNQVLWLNFAGEWLYYRTVDRMERMNVNTREWEKVL